MDPDLQHLEDALPGFLEARTLIKANDDSPRALGFIGDKFVFYRFVNRYRMALRFRGIRLDGFGKETEEGYSALTQAFLAWSVFERYTELAGIPCPYKGFFIYVPKLELSKLAQVIENNDPDWKLFDFLRSQSTPLNQSSLDKFRGGQRWAVIFYASAMRHIYVHGHLTASPRGCKSEEVAMISHELSRRLLEWIGKDFHRRLSVAAAGLSRPGN